MRGRRGLTAVVLSSLAFASGCGGKGETAVRIGILSDCYGPFSSAHELIIASAELPLMNRGGKLSGRKPSDGIEGASVAGRSVELVVGCITGTEDVLPEARRLVEEDGAQILVGPLYPEHGLVLREYARARPETTFVIQPSGAPELTLTDPAPNVFRFGADNAQSSAGLGSYAYRELGWRTAATVADDTPYGWGSVAGFVAEFCALGGRIVDREWIRLGADPATSVRRIPRSAEGVYLGAALSPMQGFVRRYSALHHDLARRLLANEVLLRDPQIAALVPGLVAAGSLPPQPTAAKQAYIAAFANAFPTIPPASALAPLATPFRDGVEAALQALERVDGDLSRGGRRFRDALARLRIDTPAGQIQLDANRHAIAPNYLSRVTTGAQGKPAITTVKVVPNVEQTFGGYFQPSDPPPSRTSPACRQGNPPPWARRPG
jgi:branched-chain amino acid transport system substrate-binding protein